ncbi:uncharacterized protein BO87DRAFT_70780 [Aspergillus neoniger CBS 115656]|uniref:Uncharacterized protein n=1 Tax=Aspergillus neoniger (strain CBS 115656) TaxID=1448310 RepID=A0A318YLG2_ASPNB|nr:hypothetical protein BO87DRAFT_70780 [Aspergillus neoniger CBS 115656]PYH33523.1 hypothetical protein BO87DRAFT_70780 [Aspergillus neoniger CBS 115656]
MEKNVIALFLFLLMLLVHGLRHLPVSSYYIQMIFFLRHLYLLCSPAFAPSRFGV